ncbi:MAG: inositol monophosphatase family protein [Microscillaceae bacterium]|nr:inositol monophosphatase family protein [Microscillaceae bacterium]
MDFENICKQVVAITHEIGNFIREEAQNFDLSRIEHKGKNDLVSYVDREAERRLISRLQEITPGCAFFSEEDENNKSITDNPFHWIIDPLDGTTNFLHGLPIYAISVGLMYEDEIVVGVVHELNRNECFYGWKDGGAYCNERKIQVSPVLELSDSLLGTGFPYRDFDKTPSYLEIIKDFMKRTHGLRRMGSAAVDLAYVATGRFQGFFEYNLNAWDVAAGALLVKEAGGLVSTFEGKDDFIFGKEIVAACAIHPQMLEVIKKHWSGNGHEE